MSGDIHPMVTGLMEMSRKWVASLLVAFLVGLPLPGLAQNRGSRNCSPIVATSTATNIVISLTCSFGEGSFDVGLIRATLACNNVAEARDRASGRGSVGRRADSARDLFTQLQRYDDKFVYVDLFIRIGVGCGLHEVKAVNPKWGVDYRPDLEGFIGDSGSYKYGYKIQFNAYAPELGNNVGSTILFPADGNGFFSAHYGNAFVLEGLAKIKISSAQGFQFIEIAPATPIGSLANHYSEFKAYLEHARRSR
jgi:hypothetical protein